MNDIQTTSPTYARTKVNDPVSLETLPWCGKINLRGNPDNQDFMTKTSDTLGLNLPLEAHTCAQNGKLTCFWLGPNEWLVHFPIDKLDSTINSLKSALKGIHSAVVDVSDYFTILRLSGEQSSELLMKACPLDLHANEFPIAMASQTRFGHASILLHKIDATPSYDIQVRWSYTEYVWDYLVSGMKAL